MRDGYRYLTKVYTLKKLKEKRVAEGAGRGEQATTYHAFDGDKTRATIVDIADLKFIEAVNLLTQKVKELVPGTGLTTVQFVEQAMKKEFGEDFSFSNAMQKAGYDASDDNDIYEYEKIPGNSEETISRLRKEHTEKAYNGHYMTEVTSEGKPVAGLIAHIDHVANEYIRNTFQSRGRGQNIQRQLADILLREFMAVTGQETLDQQICRKLIGPNRAMLTVYPVGSGSPVADLPRFVPEG